MPFWKKNKTEADSQSSSPKSDKKQGHFSNLFQKKIRGRAIIAESKKAISETYDIAFANGYQVEKDKAALLTNSEDNNYFVLRNLANNRDMAHEKDLPMESPTKVSEKAKRTVDKLKYDRAYLDNFSRIPATVHLNGDSQSSTYELQKSGFGNLAVFKNKELLGYVDSFEVTGEGYGRKVHLTTFAVPSETPLLDNPKYLEKERQSDKYNTKQKIDKVQQCLNTLEALQKDDKISNRTSLKTTVELDTVTKSVVKSGASKKSGGITGAIGTIAKQRRDSFIKKLVKSFTKPHGSTDDQEILKIPVEFAGKKYQAYMDDEWRMVLDSAAKGKKGGLQYLGINEDGELCVNNFPDDTIREQLWDQKTRASSSEHEHKEEDVDMSRGRTDSYDSNSSEEDYSDTISIVRENSGSIDLSEEEQKSDDSFEPTDHESAEDDYSENYGPFVEHYYAATEDEEATWGVQILSKEVVCLEADINTEKCFTHAGVDDNGNVYWQEDNGTTHVITQNIDTADETYHEDTVDLGNDITLVSAMDCTDPKIAKQALDFGNGDIFAITKVERDNDRRVVAFEFYDSNNTVRRVNLNEKGKVLNPDIQSAQPSSST